MDLDPTFAAWFAAARFVHYSTCLLLLGVWVFDRLTVAHAQRRWREAPFARSWRSIAGWIVLVAIPLAVVSGAGWFALVAMNMSDEPWRESLQGEVVKLVAFDTDFGHAWLVHGGLLVMLGIGAIVWRLMRGEASKAVVAWINCATAAGIVVGIAWAGHGAGANVASRCGCDASVDCGRLAWRLAAAGAAAVQAAARGGD